MIVAEVGELGDIDVLVEVDIEGLIHDETKVAVLLLFVIELLDYTELGLE